MNLFEKFRTIYMKTPRSRKFRKSPLSFEGQTRNTEIITFDSGIKIISEYIPWVNSFALGIGFKTGSRNDYPNQEGIAHLLEHLVFRKTKYHTSYELNELFEKLGAYVNAFVTKEYTLFYVRALSSNFKRIFDLLAEVVFQSNILTENLRKEKNIVREEIFSSREDPEEEIFDCADELLFQNNSLAHPITGSISSVNRISLSSIRQFYESQYTLKNSVISCVGNIPSELLLEFVTPKLEEIENENVPSQLADDILINHSVHRRYKRDYLQNHLAYFLGFKNLSDKEKYILGLVNILLAESSSSRLFKTLREKFGFVYNIYSTCYYYSDCAAIYIYSSVDKKNSNKAEKVIQEELENLYVNGISELEFEIAKQQAKSSITIANENLSEKMKDITKNYLVDGKFYDFSKVIKILDNIRIEEINNFIRTYFAPQRWSSVGFIPK